MLFSYDGDPAVLFACLYKEQPAAFASALFYRRGNLNLALLSLSPELFFRVSDGDIQCRPMKGTAPKTGDSSSDRHAVGLRRDVDSDLDLIDARSGNFYLYETILFRRRRGYWMLESHLRRLHRSARYSGMPCSMVRIRRKLQRLEYLLQRAASGNKPIRVHLRLLRSGRIKIILNELKDSKRNVTIEFCRAPALSVLVCWTVRERLARGSIHEACITADEARRASAIVLANSVRGLRRAVLIEKAD